MRQRETWLVGLLVFFFHVQLLIRNFRRAPFRLAPPPSLGVFSLGPPKTNDTVKHFRQPFSLRASAVYFSYILSNYSLYDGVERERERP